MSMNKPPQNTVQKLKGEKHISAWKGSNTPLLCSGVFD